MDNTQNIISFCTGYGGLELGLELAGVDVQPVAYVEIEAYAVGNLVAKMETGQLVRALCGRILKPSLHDSFVTAYTASLPVIRASRSAPRENGREQPILDTFGRLYESMSVQSDLFGAASKTSQDTSGWDSTRFTKTFEKWVTQLRRDSLRRQKSAHLTSGSGCLSWPTAKVSIGDYCYSRGDHGKPVMNLSGAVKNWRTPNGSDGEGGIMENLPGKDGHYKLRDQVNWPTVQASEARQGYQDRTRGKKGNQKSLSTVVIDGLPAPDKSNTNGSRQGQLNPAWVACLMGITPEWISFDFAETELCLNVQRKHG